MKSMLCPAVLLCSVILSINSSAAPSVARTWNERALAAIRADTPHPPAQARNLFSLSVCMYDAWAAYDTNGSTGYIYHGKHTASDIAAARREAISYAAFRLLRERHVYSRTALSTLIADTNQLTALGYSAANTSLDTSTPAGVGNSVYAAVSAWFINDGSRQTNGTPYPLANPPIAYPDYPVAQGGYVYINPYPLATDRPGIDDGFGHTVIDINHWQRLQVVNAVDQNGFPAGPIQNYLGAQWLGVRPFALTRTDPTKPWIDPGAPPFFGTASHVEFISNIVEVIRYGSELTPDDGVTLDISPASLGNNSLGANDGHGRPLNPVTGLPYTPTIAKRGDFARALTEFWADGPTSETPPGHWNVVANDIADHPLTVKRIGGTGPVVDDLEWDVKTYFALNAATHEAACAAWAVKRYYDGWRPLGAIRYAGALGQSSNPASPSYNANGLPLVPNLIELVTASTVASGRHAGLTPGKIAVLGWPGETGQRTNANGVHFIHADTWTTYQRSNFVTPAFPGYISGHSTFSRSAAELLTAFTGSPFFPGGMGTYTITNLLNEKGPSQPVTLQWATYFDAADQVGLSRIWGGIHPPADDFAGRRVGAQCGLGVWALAQKFFSGSAGPVLTCSSNIIAECTGGLTPVTYTVTAVDVFTNALPVTCVPPSGSGFRLGQSNVVCSATDGLGQSRSCTFTVTIVDTVPPQVTCSTNISGLTKNPSGVVQTYIASASDACGIASFECLPPSGSTFPIGLTTVVCKAFDGAGNSNSCSLTVTLTLITPPTLACPGDVRAECTGALTPVNFTVTAKDFLNNALLVTCTPPSGTGFRLGQSNVVCTASDSLGQSNSCIFTVTVVDTTPPQVNCPGDITVTASNSVAAVVTYTASAFDACGVRSFECSPASGSLFPVGVTTVTCKAFDSVGNSNSCSFRVTVRSLNESPVALARIACATPVTNNAQLISLNNSDACVILDASESSDPDQDPLTFRWTIDGQSTLNGASVTNCFAVGCHSVLLEVSDGPTVTRLQTNVCVITACEAVEQCVALVDGSNLGRKNKRPLISSLRAACALFEEGHFVPALNALEAFQNKVAAQVAPANPGEAEAFTQCAQRILDAIHCAAVLGLNGVGEESEPPRKGGE